MPSKKVSKKVAGKKVVSKSVAKRVKIQAEVAPEVPVNITYDAPVNAPVVTGINFSNVVFEGAKVMKVLTTKETPTHFHCQMSDGTSKHVPKSLFE